MRRVQTSIAVLAVAAATIHAPAWATPGEPLVVTQLPDPDPDFVPPPEPKRSAQTARSSNAKPTLAEAMEMVGRAAGDAARMAEQRARHELQDAERQACNAVRAARGSGIDHSDLERRCGL